jgi:hypothetical protein
LEFVFPFAAGTFALEIAVQAWRSVIAGRCGEPVRFRHTHHLLSDAVHFLLVLIAELVDYQLGLDRRPHHGESAEHSLVSDCAVQWCKRILSRARRLVI